MSSPTIEFDRMWIDQCAATEDIRQSFGRGNVLDYPIGEKLFNYLMASERDPHAPRPSGTNEVPCATRRGAGHRRPGRRDRRRILVRKSRDGPRRVTPVLTRATISVALTALAAESDGPTQVVWVASIGLIAFFGNGRN